MARSTGALRRARDIPDAESLLRLLLMHVANGYSLAETAARAGQLGMELSAVAVFKRLRASEEWLRWLAEQLRGTQPLAAESQAQFSPEPTLNAFRRHISYSSALIRLQTQAMSGIACRHQSSNVNLRGVAQQCRI